MQWTRSLAALRQRWLVVVLAMLGGVGVGLAAAAVLPVRYESTATVFLSLDRGGSATEFNAGSIFALNLVDSYAEVATMPVVLRPVVVDLDLDATPAELARQVRVDVPADTTLLAITVTDRSAGRAADIANAIAARLQDAVVSLSPRTEAGGAALRVTTTSEATPATRPTSVPSALVVTAALVAGLLAGLAAVAALETVRRPVRSKDDVRTVTAAPVVGTVPDDRTAVRDPLPVLTSPGRPRTEELLVLAAIAGRLHDGGPPPCVMVTSAGTGEGRTGVAVNLAIALARASHRVLLIDGDLWRPHASDLLDAAGRPGLAEVLREESPLSAAVQPWSGPLLGGTRLHVLPAGSAPESSTHLLASGFDAVLQGARALHDVVVIDAPPLLPGADAATIATHVAHVLLVVDARRTRLRDLREAVSRVDAAESTLLGVVLNRTAAGGRIAELRRRRSRSRPTPPPPAAADERRPAAAPSVDEPATTAFETMPGTAVGAARRPSPTRR